LPLRELGGYFRAARKCEVSRANPRLLLDAMVLLDGLDEVADPAKRAGPGALIDAAGAP